MRFNGRGGLALSVLEQSRNRFVSNRHKILREIRAIYITDDSQLFVLEGYMYETSHILISVYSTPPCHSTVKNRFRWLSTLFESNRYAIVFDPNKATESRWIARWFTLQIPARRSSLIFCLSAISRYLKLGSVENRKRETKGKIAFNSNR